LRQQFLNLLADHIKRHGIGAVWDDDIRIPLGGLHVSLVHFPHRGQILGGDGVEAPSPFCHVPLYTAQNADVRLRVNVDFDVDEVEEVGGGENEDSLQNDDAAGDDGFGFGGSGMPCVIVFRDMYRFPRLQTAQMLREKLRFKGGGLL